MSEPTTGRFEPTDREAWLALVKKELKGAEYRSLDWNHPELGAIEPYPAHHAGYAQLTLPPRSYQAEIGFWEIRQAFNPQTDTNEEVLKALMAGVNHIVISVDAETTTEQLHKLLDGVYLNMVSVSFIGQNAAQGRSIFLAWSAELQTPSILTGSVLFDPIFEAFRNNTIASELQTQLSHHCGAIAHTKAAMRTIGIGASQLFEAGGGDALEVAAALMVGSEYLDAICASGGTVDDWAPKFEFELAAGQSYFLTIAKFRALRHLWAHVIERHQPKHACSVVTWINAETSQRHFSSNDPHNNLLRLTTSALGALTGGCDSLLVSPFTPWEFSRESRRWSRNIHHLLADESGINPNEDCGSGSRYIEHLTTQFIEKVMFYLNEVEACGGINTSAGLNWLKANVSAHRQALIHRVQTKEHAIIGVNLFPPQSSSIEPHPMTDHWLTPVRLPYFLFDQVKNS